MNEKKIKEKNLNKLYGMEELYCFPYYGVSTVNPERRILYSGEETTRKVSLDHILFDAEKILLKNARVKEIELQSDYSLLSYLNWHRRSQKKLQEAVSDHKPIWAEFYEINYLKRYGELGRRIQEERKAIMDKNVHCGPVLSV
jgi:hypothetical protein